MPYSTKLDPPILFGEGAGRHVALSTVEDVIDFIRRYDRPEWEALRNTAFIAAAVPSAENIDALRDLAKEAFSRAL